MLWYPLHLVLLLVSLTLLGRAYRKLAEARDDVLAAHHANPHADLGPRMARVNMMGWACFFKGLSALFAILGFISNAVHLSAPTPRQAALVCITMLVTGAYWAYEPDKEKPA